MRVICALLHRNSFIDRLDLSFGLAGYMNDNNNIARGLFRTCDSWISVISFCVFVIFMCLFLCFVSIDNILGE